MTPQAHKAMVEAYLQNGGEISSDLAGQARYAAGDCALGKWLTFGAAVPLIALGIGHLPAMGAVGSIVAGALSIYAAYRCQVAERSHRAISHAYMQRESLRKQLGQ